MGGIKKVASMIKFILTNLAWWVYFVGALCLFLGALLLNYIVEKINEARLEKRSIRLGRLGNKLSTNESTQVQSDSLSKTLAANVTETAKTNQGISLVLNKEENLVEDKRSKDIDGKTVENVEIGARNSSDILTGNAIQSALREDSYKPAFLGSIYRELFEKRANIEKSKSLSNADRDSILSEIVDKMVSKMNESKSTPSIKKLIDIQNEMELKDWALDLVKTRGGAPASTSECS